VVQAGPAVVGFWNAVGMIAVGAALIVLKVSPDAGDNSLP
jgi:hypothetical protein